jgi:copper chaperone NosL
MTIADPRFVAEAVLATGKVLPFDDIGCLVAWLATNERPVKAVWVAAFADQQWLPAAEASYLRTDSLRTPMASGLIAARTAAETDSLRARLGGIPMSWDEIASLPSPHGSPHTP